MHEGVPFLGKSVVSFDNVQYWKVAGMDNVGFKEAYRLEELEFVKRKAFHCEIGPHK